MSRFSKIKRYLDPFAETRDLLDKLREDINNSEIAELNRKSKMSEEEIKNEELTIKANHILDILESDIDLYRIFNNIIREKKLKKLNGNN